MKNTNSTSTLARTKQRLARLVRLARSHGISRAVFRLVLRLSEVRLWKRWCSLSVVEVYHVPVAELKRSGRVPRVFTIRKAQREDLPALEEYFEHSPVGERYSRGDICLAAFAKDQIGAGVWFAVGPKGYSEDWQALRCVVRFPQGVAWTFDGKGTKLGAWGAMMMRLPELLEELAAEEVYTLIDYDNQESIDAHLSLGYRRVGVLTHFSLFALKLSILKEDGHGWQRLPGRIGKIEFHGNKSRGDWPSGQQDEPQASVAQRACR